MKLTLPLFLLLISLSLCVLGQDSTTPTPPKYCHPCLFYGGDSPAQNGLANEKDIIVSDGAEVLVPFDVPDSQQWTVTGLFTNDLSNIDVLDPPKAFWSIRKDVRAGDCGTVIASGNTNATFKPTGRGGNGYKEYTTLTKINPVILPPGRYWLTTVPECTNTHDSKCEDNARYFISSFTGKGKQAYGPKEPCAAFFNSPFFGTNCQPASDRNQCVKFSAGVLGTK
ncbi:MAG TPA: hypothetical protein VK829_05975 [Terriglobales bacterium]|jgi:hypothetical protein|nr:hypothetical protein [Terriglobales bacterium]